MLGEVNTDALLAVLGDEAVPAWRATILGLLAQQPRTTASLQAARNAAQDASAMVRAAAAQVLGQESIPLINDPVKIVRRAAAWPNIATLVRYPQAQAVVQEMEAIARQQADQPTGAMQLAVLASVRGQFAEAEKQYRRAIQLDPAGPVGYMDYAVFLAQMGRPQDALLQMEACSRVAPQNAEVWYRLALVQAELGQYEPALDSFKRAVELEPTHERARGNLQQLELYLQSLKK